MRSFSWHIFLLLLVFVLQHSFFDLWVLTSNFTLVFMMHWCYPWHLSLKLHWLLSWQLNCFNTCLCNMATSVVFSIKLHKHSLLPRSLINTHLCNEATVALFFSHKAGSTLHLHWSHGNIHVCHEVASPLIFVMKLRQLLHLHWSITITLSTEENLHLSFLMKPFQHEAMLTLHL